MGVESFRLTQQELVLRKGPLLAPLFAYWHAGPGPVTVIQVLTYATEVQLKWTAPTHPNGPFTGYNVSCLGNSQIDSLGPAVTEHTCEGLSANRTYSIRIFALNKFGAGLAALKTVKTACECECDLVCLEWSVP